MDQELVEPCQVERAVLIKALIAGKSALHAYNGPFRNWGRVRGPIEDSPHILDLLVRTGQAGEELLNVQKFSGELLYIVIVALELFAKLLEKRPLAVIESLDKQRVKPAEVLQAPEFPIGREETVEAH